MNRWSALALVFAIIGGLALRAPKLDTRPLHNDEGVNATTVAKLWEHGRYAYDPDEYHGPTLHYATLPFLWLSGAGTPDELQDSTLRLPTVAFGVGLILLLLLFLDAYGRHAIAWAALFIAVSPAMVFYSRYFIHEMLLAFFTALTLGAAWRYMQTRLARWAVVTGIGAGLMFATKETFVIAMAAMAGAGVATAFLTWRENRSTSPGAAVASWRIPWRHIMLAILACLIVWFCFFSSFFTNFQGLPDSIRTYFPWLKRAGGHSPHIHPWHFYLERLAWFHPAKKGPPFSEGLILGLAVIGAIISLRRKGSVPHRFLVFYTFLLTAAYCVIPYKTPWCLLGFYWGMILLAGVGAAGLIEWGRARSARFGITTILLLVTAHLTWQAWRASFVYASDQKNPYVYAQTLPNLARLVERAEGIARVSPAGYNTVVKIITPGGDYWPLPWYLRRFQHVGWYDQMPREPLAPIVVVSSRLNARLDDLTEKKWLMVGYAELRPRVFLEMYVELELWKKYVETLPRNRGDD